MDSGNTLLFIVYTCETLFKVAMDEKDTESLLGR